MLDRKLFDKFVLLPELEEALAQRATAFHDKVLPASAMSMDEATGNLVTRNGTSTEHSLQDHALGLLASRLQIPVSYLRRCPADLRAENVNHWLAGLRDRPLLIRFDGEDVRAILTDRYTVVDNLDLVRRLRQACDAKGVTLSVRYEWTAQHFVCQVVAPHTEKPVRGDRFLEGMHCTNSEVGLGPVMIEALVIRCVCSNGMVVHDASLKVARVHRTRVSFLAAEIDRVMRQVGEVLPRVETHLVRATEEPLSLTAEGWKQLFAEAGIGEATATVIQEHFTTQGEPTRFGLVNAITAVANQPDLGLADREALQRWGGRFLVQGTRAKGASHAASESQLGPGTRCRSAARFGLPG